MVTEGATLARKFAPPAMLKSFDASGISLVVTLRQRVCDNDITEILILFVRRGEDVRICLFVCLSVRSTKKNDPTVFKLGIEE